ncbi:MAG: AlpA family transcriptional regulator [Pseudomonadales bacterium]|nr:AlpA family transcriptional regulator [Pseudomonadales bacterium]
MATTILRLPDVKARTGLSRSTIYLRVAEGKFPSPVALGGRAVGWVEAELDAWLTQQINSRRQISKSGRAI